MVDDGRHVREALCYCSRVLACHLESRGLVDENGKSVDASCDADEKIRMSVNLFKVH